MRPTIDPVQAPRFLTPPSPELRSSGRRVEAVAEAIGTPLFAWQRYVADVASEQLPDGSYHYPTVVVTVPRQSGKTTLMRAYGVERGIAYPGLECFYTAQSGLHARERWRDLVKQLRSSPLRGQITIREAAGAERVILPNGSEFRCFAPKPDALHGYTPPLVMLDEVWKHDAALGAALLGAIGPAQITIQHRQLWIVSTAGTAASTFLQGWVDAGRRGQDGVALFDWGFPDDQLDPYDPQLWATTHPAWHELRPDGTRQVTADALQAEADRLPRGEFLRAYGNLSTLAQSVLIPAEAWRDQAARLPESMPSDQVVLAYDVAHDRSRSAVLAVWRADDGKLCGRVVMYDTGTSWLAPAVAELWKTQPPIAVAADDGGPARLVTDQLRGMDVPVTTLDARTFSMATTGLLAAIDDGQLAHDGSTELANAAAGAEVRPLSDGIAFSRRYSAGDISPLVAYCVGGWVFDHQEAAYDYGPSVMLGA